MSSLPAKALRHRLEPSNSGRLPLAPGAHLARGPVPSSLRRPVLAAAAHLTCSHPSWSPPLSCPCLLVPPADTCSGLCCHRCPPVPPSANAEVATFADNAHGPPLPDALRLIPPPTGTSLPGTRLPGSHTGLATLQQPQGIVSTGNNFVSLKSTYESST
ncbi:Phosphatidylinositol 4,5-Bisphosphate 5-Phosphatase A [Manis pentadactyla]|nr:Phosphatidylinositol 4,5-Bisphosphate 5-Phosphatase A [Manis pentadactyla]